MTRMFTSPAQIFSTEQINPGPGFAALNNCPPEILQEIFARCCGHEYIDVILHLGIKQQVAQERNAQEEDLRLVSTNTVLVLKAVCKDWEFLVERTSSLWQRICLDIDSNSRHYGHTITLSPPQCITDTATQYCASKLKHSILRRSGGLPLHIRIGGTSPPNSCTAYGALKKECCLEQALLRSSLEESRRWTTLAISCGIKGLGRACLDYLHSVSLITSISSSPSTPSAIGTFPSLNNLSLDLDQCYGGLYPAERAPQSSELVVDGDLSGLIAPSAVGTGVRWEGISKLVLVYRYAVGIPPPAPSQIACVLQSMPNLVSFHWQGLINSRIPPSSSAESDTSRRATVRLDRLQHLTVEDSQLGFCTLILPVLTFPRLEVFEMMVCESSPRVLHTGAQYRGAMASVRDFLRRCSSAELGVLRNVTVVNCPLLDWRNGTWCGEGKEPEDVRFLCLAGPQSCLRKQLGMCGPRFPHCVLDSPVLTPLLQRLIVLTRFMDPGYRVIPQLTGRSQTAEYSVEGAGRGRSSENRLAGIFDFVNNLAQTRRQGEIRAVELSSAFTSDDMERDCELLLGCELWDLQIASVFYGSD